MKSFDRTKFKSNRRSHPICFVSKLNPLIILFVLVLGLNNPHPILDYTNFTPETKTFVKREETKITLKTPRPIQSNSQKSTNSNPKNYITLSGRNIEIFISGNTNIDSGSRVGLYGNGFLYGHRSTVFGSLGSIQTFSITLNGVTKNYSVINRVTLPKTCANSPECAEKYMYPLTKYQSYRSHHYNLVLMTCAGTTDPNNPADASHRLIVFANEI